MSREMGFNPNFSKSAEQKPTPVQIDYLRGLPVSSIRKARGKGGQSVNTTASAAELRWRVGASDGRIFSDEEKAKLITYFSGKKGRWNKETGEAIIVLVTERSFESNKRLVFEQLIKEVTEALAEEAERIPTKPTLSARRARVADKKHRGSLKKQRGQSWEE